MVFKFGSLVIFTFANLLRSAEASWCLGTGTGTCNLNIFGTPVITEGVHIYDNECNLIGYLNRPVEGVAINSQLPWTVVLKHIANDDRHFTFCYAGKCYVNGFTFQETDEGGYTAIEALHAFDCGDEVRFSKTESSFSSRRHVNETDFV
ncbi:hypothetical protein TSTA_053370 [Talaromyces stipitatus ATCC 10500]|uniref:Uncharacterized protein n=1 Tax=Talaromyces stipitatus (strain ATCC 10500 / CBS 375.48 / QM 6759 / NRRL 1006) TaxID=441959 RepID=B8MQY4_TALSN|nr:uncharacterized protein TSTA_053370 [Talaromyces stipitatus ATCC 10500]EED12819.1 hypothetical protein TSTA_053370 [Talaromyces stipitatus ATCC 10500]